MSEDLLSRWAAQGFWLSLAFATLLLLAEGWRPRSRTRVALGRRWVANLLSYSTASAVMWMLPPLGLLSVAALAQANDWGLFNAAHAPWFVSVPLCVLAIDLSGYVVHRLEHRHALLWRLHRLHHSDPDVDVTTTYRLHPLEVVMRGAAQALVGLALGIPMAAAAGYALLSAFTSVASHANLALPQRLERLVGGFVITPGIHRTHHSADPGDANSNFSVCLSLWDRLFDTYRPAPLLGHGQAVFGVESRTVEQATSGLRMLVDPFLPEHAATTASAAATSKP